MRPVENVPATMIDRIAVAKASIEGQKQHAKEMGFEYRQVSGPFFSFTDEAIEIYELLASHPDMNKVWQKLNRIFDDRKRPSDTWRFADFCYQTWDTWRHSPVRSPADHTAYFAKIASDIMDVVSRVVHEPEFGMIGQMDARVSVLEMISNGKIRDLMEAVNSDLVDGEIIKCEEDAVGFFRFQLVDAMPRLIEYAAWIAERATQISAQPSLSDRPTRKTAHRTFFVKHLSKYFRERFSQPMHEIVAGVASAIFNEAVTADTVRKAVNS